MTTLKRLRRCQSKNPEQCRVHGTPNPFITEYSKANSYSHSARVMKTKSNTSAAEGLALKSILAISEGNEALSREYAEQFYNLPESQKFIAFRNSTAEESLELFTSLTEKLKKEIGIEKPKYAANSSNKIGSDLEEETTNTSVELKFGGSTDMNLGMASFQEILPASLFNILPTNEDRVAWRVMYTQGKADEQLHQYHSKLASITKKFEENPESFALNAKAQHILNNYYVGVNSKKEIDSTFNVKQKPRNIIRIFLQKDRSWERLSHPMLEKTDTWKIHKVRFSEQNKRLSFVFVSTNGWKITMAYNHKNNYMLNGEKVAAKQGLGSPSLNGWVTAPSSEERIS